MGAGSAPSASSPSASPGLLLTRLSLALGQIRCLQCQHESNTYDPMLDLSLELTGASGGACSSVDAAMKQFTKAEYLEQVSKP